VPTIGLVQVGRQALADRYAYEAYLGLFIMVCWGVADWAKQHRVRVGWLAGASAIVLLALALVTYRQIGYWKDDLTLWTHATKVVPNDWTAETNIGIQLLKQGKAAEAMDHFHRAISLYPYEAISNMEVGYVEQTRGDYRAAIMNYQNGLVDFTLPDEERAQIWRNMGVCYRELGDLDKARECFANEASLGGAK